MENIDTPSHLFAAAVVPLTPGSCTLFASRLFSGIIERGLQKENVELSNCGAFWGEGFVVAAAMVREIKPALQAMFRTVESCKPMNQYPREIAYWDADEGFWRTVYPEQAAAPFSRFLTPEIMAASQHKCEEEIALFEACFALAKRLGAAWNSSSPGHPLSD